MVLYRKLYNGKFEQVGVTKPAPYDNSLNIVVLHFWATFHAWLGERSQILVLRGVEKKDFDRIRAEVREEGFLPEKFIMITADKQTALKMDRRISCPCGLGPMCPNYRLHMLQELGISL